MSDLYLKVTNDINEEVLLCYIYSNTGACYGLKYSPNNTNQLSIVVLNSRQTEVESEQTGAEKHELSKDDLIHIYTDSSQGLGGFLVSSIHNGIETIEPSPFILQAKDGSGRVNFDNEPFSFAGLRIDNFSQKSNSITEISSYEYESKVNSIEISSENKTNPLEEQGTAESETSTPESSDSVTDSITTATTTTSPLSTTETGNGKSIIGIVLIFAITITIIILTIKFNLINKLFKMFKGKKHNNTANNLSQAPITANFIDCKIINQSICRDNKKLLAHSLFKGEDSELNFDVKLAAYKDFEYYRDQNASKIRYRRLYSTAKVPDSAFIIGLTKDWELVIAQHNSHSSITLDIFNVNYLIKTGMDIGWVYKFLSENIREFEYDLTDINIPASSFFRLLTILTSLYANDVYANDSRILSVRRVFSQNKSKWDTYFKEQMPARIDDAIIIISELFFMKNLARRGTDNKWERLVEAIQAIKIEIDNRIRTEEEKTAIHTTAGPIVQPSIPSNNQNNFNDRIPITTPASSPQASQSQFGTIIKDPVPTTSSIQRSAPIAQPKETLNDIIKMYADASGYFSNKIPPDFCKPASDVTAYRITNPYKLTMIPNKSRPAIPEFILIGNNLFPNPYRFKNGIIKADDINRIILDEVYELNRTSTGTISQITPAKVDLNSMTVTEKGKITFVD